MIHSKSGQFVAFLLAGSAPVSAAIAQNIDPATTQVEMRMTTGPVQDMSSPSDHAPLTRTIAARGDGAPAATAQMTRDNGAPIGENRNSKAAGDTGPVLLEDTTLIEKLARFDREREPERVVHARGTGAEGVFVASRDISDITKASLFVPG
jgi:catalase